MISQDTVVNYSNGEDFVASILNRPIDQLDANQQAIAAVLNAILEYTAGSGELILKHDDVDTIKTTTTGFTIKDILTFIINSSDASLRTADNDAGSITIQARKDDNTFVPVLKVFNSPDANEPTGFVLYQDGVSMFSTDKDGAERILNAHGKRITSVATPTSTSDAATKGYVDTVVGGSFVSGHFTYNGTTMVPQNTVGISSIDKIGTGVYRINFSTPFPDENYKLVAFCTQDNSGNRIVSIGENPNEARTASYCSVRAAINGLGTLNPANMDVIITY